VYQLVFLEKKKNKSRVAGGEALFSFGKERGGDGPVLFWLF
jgi:hypothetical protein